MKTFPKTHVGVVEYLAEVVCAITSFVLVWTDQHILATYFIGLAIFARLGRMVDDK